MEVLLFRKVVHFYKNTFKAVCVFLVFVKISHFTAKRRASDTYWEHCPIPVEMKLLCLFIVKVHI